MVSDDDFKLTNVVLAGVVFHQTDYLPTTETFPVQDAIFPFDQMDLLLYQALSLPLVVKSLLNNSENYNQTGQLYKIIKHF